MAAPGERSQKATCEVWAYLRIGRSGRSRSGVGGDPAALDAAQAIIDDLAHGRVQGKLLGERHVSGDLTGLARVNFDIPSRRPQRFRLIHRQVDEGTRHVVAIGLRDEHAIYRTAVRRVVQP